MCYVVNTNQAALTRELFLLRISGYRQAKQLTSAYQHGLKNESASQFKRKISECRVDKSEMLILHSGRGDNGALTQSVADNGVPCVSSCPTRSRSTHLSSYTGYQVPVSWSLHANGNRFGDQYFAQHARTRTVFLWPICPVLTDPSKLNCLETSI